MIFEVTLTITIVVGEGTYTDFSNINKKVTASAEFIVMLFTPVTSSVKLSLKDIVIVIYFVCACVCPHFQ